jgi:AcrR family transcriptional regulator
MPKETTEQLPADAAWPSIKDLRRARILDSAVAVIGSRGLAETRVADVAAHAGTSAPTVLYYFDSKDRLISAALGYAEQRFREQMLAELDEIDDAPARLLHLFERNMGEVAAWRLWVELWPRALRDERLAAVGTRLDAAWREMLVGILRDGAQDGTFAAPDLDRVGAVLGTLMDGLGLKVAISGDEHVIAHAVDLLIDVAEDELGVTLRQDA